MKPEFNGEGESLKEVQEFPLAREVGKLTTDFRLFLLSSKSNPPAPCPPLHQINSVPFSTGLSRLSPPGFLPMKTDCFIPAPHSSRHAPPTCRPLLPEKQIA